MYRVQEDPDQNVITRDLNTINIDLKKAIKLSKDRDLYNEMRVDRVMATAVENIFLWMETRSKRSSRSTARLAEAGRNAKTTKRSRIMMTILR